MFSGTNFSFNNFQNDNATDPNKLSLIFGKTASSGFGSTSSDNIKPFAFGANPLSGFGSTSSDNIKPFGANPLNSDIVPFSFNNSLELIKQKCEKEEKFEIINNLVNEYIENSKDETLNKDTLKELLIKQIISLLKK